MGADHAEEPRPARARRAPGRPGRSPARARPTSRRRAACSLGNAPTTTEPLVNPAVEAVVVATPRGSHRRHRGRRAGRASRTSRKADRPPPGRCRPRHRRTRQACVPLDRLSASIRSGIRPRPKTVDSGELGRVAAFVFRYSRPASRRARARAADGILSRNVSSTISTCCVSGPGRRGARRSARHGRCAVRPDWKSHGPADTALVTVRDDSAQRPPPTPARGGRRLRRARRSFGSEGMASVASSARSGSSTTLAGEVRRRRARTDRRSVRRGVHRRAGRLRGLCRGPAARAPARWSRRARPGAAAIHSVRSGELAESTRVGLVRVAVPDLYSSGAQALRFL